MTTPIRNFQTKLLAWFDQYGRKHLPWQHNKTPYRVWISEIMLQQTQVSTVIPYFERFMATFPNLASLAKAPENAVLHLWAGLGYYSRARNLQLAAKKIMTDFDGQFPDTLTALQTLPGIGPSTAGAILAIAFNQQATILDGNVKRVLARLHGITAPINEKATENALWQLATHYTPKERVADYTQAMMDLGATFCTRSKPQCPACPFKKNCIAQQEALTHVIPQKKIAKKIPTKEATFLILKNDKLVLLCKRPSTGIWGGLYSLPELNGQPDIATINKLCQKQFNLTAIDFKPLSPFRHTFSHYHLHIYPVIVETKKARAKIMEDDQQIWYNPDKPKSVGLPKPIQTIMRDLP